MNNTIVRSSLAALAFFGMLATATAAPAHADGAASTRTIIAGLAAAAAIATIVNVDNKNAVANRVVGYLSDGSTVYADGRVVARNGYAWYPGNNGQTVSCNGQQCYLTANGGGYTSYNNNGYNNNDYNSGYNTYGYGGGYGGYAAVPVYGSVNIYSGSYGYSGHPGGNYARNVNVHNYNSNRDNNRDDNRNSDPHWNGNGNGNAGTDQAGNAWHGQPGGQHGNDGGNDGGNHGGGNHGGWDHGSGHGGNGQHS